MEEDREALRRWRMVLASPADIGNGDQTEEGELSASDQRMVAALSELYDPEEYGQAGGMGASQTHVHRWLGDIRTYFPTPVVQMMQQDALDRLGLRQMLLEPEFLEAIVPDIHLVNALLQLKEAIPDKTKETARSIVAALVKEIEEHLRQPIRQSIKGALHRSVRNNRPKLREINWNKTIAANLKHYQPEHSIIIPEKWIGYGKQGNGMQHVYLLMDQSGSMMGSLVYASVLGAVLASIQSLKTRFIAFSTEVVDMSDYLKDPVDILFGPTLSGGTFIGAALQYVQPLIDQPTKSTLFLISDLFEGGSEAIMLDYIHQMVQAGVQIIVILALSDEGKPSYDKEMAQQLANFGIPSFACTPGLLPELLGVVFSKGDLQAWNDQRAGAK